MITARRFDELKAGAKIQPNEEQDYQSLLRWEKRSAAAKRAVQTKRRKYKAWPTKKGDHK